jgi:ATP-dependent RNA helicase RhlE
MTFDRLSLINPILKALEEEGYTTPTPIQKESIPKVLAGRDLLGCAQTGTGKTAAFAIPILQKLYRKEEEQEAAKKSKAVRKIRSLIVTPTRELAMQIKESFEAYGRYTNLRCTVIFGGVGQQNQVNAITNGVDILIATPGRLLDLINQKHISLNSVEIFVLDEADRMLDMWFIHDVKRILALLPKKRQSLFFSATMAPEIVKLSHEILYNPEKVTVTPVSSTVEIIDQKVYFVDKANKNFLLLHLLEDISIKTVLVFTRTKHGANKVVKVLLEKGITADAIHGNKAQNARQKALKNFKEQTLRVLVATDIAARGIDVDELEWVINYDVPNVSETYVHRIGRTWRAGAKWTALSFSDAEERTYIADIEKLIAKKIPIVEDHPFPLIQQNVGKRQPQGRGNFSHPYVRGEWTKKTVEKSPSEKKPGKRPQWVPKPPRPKPTWGTDSTNLPEDLHRRETPRFPKPSENPKYKKPWKRDDSDMLPAEPKDPRDGPKKSWRKNDDGRFAEPKALETAHQKNLGTRMEISRRILATSQGSQIAASHEPMDPRKSGMMKKSLNGKNHAEMLQRKLGTRMVRSHDSRKDEMRNQRESGTIVRIKRSGKDRKKYLIFILTVYWYAHFVTVVAGSISIILCISLIMMRNGESHFMMNELFLSFSVWSEHRRDFLGRRYSIDVRPIVRCSGISMWIRFWNNLMKVFLRGCNTTMSSKINSKSPEYAKMPLPTKQSWKIMAHSMPIFGASWMANRSVNHPDVYKNLPASTEISEKLSKSLKKYGFTFVGPTICYAFMQAAWLVNDHEVVCKYR